MTDSRIAIAPAGPYRMAMEAVSAYLEFRIDTSEPIELYDFVRAFTSLGEQYERYLSRIGLVDTSAAKIYIKRVREGSIIAELFPVILPIIADMDSVLIVREFSMMVRDRLAPYLQPGGRVEGIGKSELKELMGGVAAIANDPDGKATIASVRMVEGRELREVVLHFESRDAKTAVRQIEQHYQELSLPVTERAENVLMVFFQSNKRIPGTEQKSGEQAIIESMSPKPRPIVYASELARQRIKDEIFHGNENLYKRGFYVDIEVDRYQGRVAAYKILAVHDIIDLPDED